MIAEDLVGDHVARHQPGDEAVSGDRRARLGIARPAIASPPPQQRHEVRVEVHPAGDPEVAGEQHDELLEVAVQRRVRRHLDAEVFVDRHAAGRRADRPRRLADVASSTPARAHDAAMSIVRRWATHLVDARWRCRPANDRRAGPPRRGSRAARPADRRRRRAEAAGGCRRDRPISVRRGSTTISVRAGSLAISLRILRACGKPCDCHGFLPQNTATSACS